MIQPVDMDIDIDATGRVIVTEYRRLPVPAPELPAIASLRLRQLRDELALQTAYSRLHVTAEQAYADAAIYAAVIAEKQEILRVLRKYD